MATKSRSGRLLAWIIGIFVFISAALGFATDFMLGFSLSPDRGRENVDSVALILYERYPDIKPWLDSIKTNES